MSETVFCIQCGAETREGFRGGRNRRVCPKCSWIYWRNPKVGVAVILRDDRGGVLLVRRKGSFEGAWCIPCGNVEWDEDIGSAARRELQEETGLAVVLGPVYAVLSNFHDPRDHSVGVWFLGRLESGTLQPGTDAGAAGWFDPARPPEPLAFPTDARVLEALAGGAPHIEGF